MTPLAYGVALRTLALWTSGQVTESEAQLAWNELAEAGHTTVKKPSRTEWPDQLKRPQSAEVWGSWQHIIAAISPAGFLAVLLGDDEFRSGLLTSVEKASKAAAGAVTTGLKVVLGVLVVVGVIGVGALALRSTAARPALGEGRRR